MSTRRYTSEETRRYKRDFRIPTYSEQEHQNTFNITCKEIQNHRIETHKPLKRNSPSQEKPIAIFIVGPPGSGKTTLLENHLLPETFQYDYYNVDEYYEPLLELKRDISKQLRNDLMTLAKDCMRIDYYEMLKNKKNMVIDRAGGRSKSIIDEKEQLEAQDNPYKTYMIAIYTPSNVSVERDKHRKRTLGKNTVNKLWSDFMKNLLYYKEQFRDNFILIDNSNNETQIMPHPEITSYNGFNIHVSVENNHLNFKFARSQKPKGSLPLTSIEQGKHIIQTFLSQQTK